MIRKCDDCAHSKVCIYKKKYQENYKTLEKELNYDKPFSIELNCDEYEPRNYNLTLNKGLEINTTPSIL